MGVEVALSAKKFPPEYCTRVRLNTTTM